MHTPPYMWMCVCEYLYVYTGDRVRHIPFKNVLATLHSS